MPHKILIVEDEQINLALVKFGLKTSDFDVISACDGDIALQKVQSDKPDLIVLDLGLPNMNGYEFMQALKDIEGGEQIPIIVLSGSESMSEVVEHEGVKHFFNKPVHLPTLVEKIRKCLG